MHATLTSKGQITLPKDLREKLGLTAGDRVEFILEDDHGVRLVARYTPVNQFKGMLPRPKRTISLEEMDRTIRKGGQKK